MSVAQICKNRRYVVIMLLLLKKAVFAFCIQNVLHASKNKQHQNTLNANRENIKQIVFKVKKNNVDALPYSLLE